jgi:hypothetical protein
MVTGEVGSLEAEDPLYYKSRIYAGRAMYMIIPHRWTYAAGVGRQIFEELERAGFRDNRYVQWFLHDTWKPQSPDWIFPDYSAAKQGAPAWAAEIYEAYNRELDWESGGRNRQAADGSLGGGWGTMSKSCGCWGIRERVIRAGPLLMDGIRRSSTASGIAVRSIAKPVILPKWLTRNIAANGYRYADLDDPARLWNPLYVERARRLAS